MNILLLEDNKTDADLAKRGLCDLIPDCNVEIAYTLELAKEKLLEDITFDIAILDMQLPDGSGMDLLLEIRQSGPEIPVVILTGSGNEEFATAALKAGADDYINKRQGYISKLPGVIDYAISNHKKNMLIKLEIIEILYIEHHSSDIDLTLRHLHQYAPNIHVSPVSSAEAALHLIPENETDACSFDVILLDYRLPGLNALEFTKIIRQVRMLTIPVILVTGQGNEEIAIQALKLGVDEYLVKRENYLFRLPSLILNVHQRHELIRKQSALTESESKYRLLAENSADVIFTLDLDLNYTYISPSVYKLRGFTPEEVLAENISASLTPDSYQRAVQLISAKLSEAENPNSDQVETVNVELELIRKDKSTVWTEIKATILLDENKKPKGILGVTRDISQKKLYEEELYHSREEYKLFFEDDLTGDYLATTEGQILNCNPAYIKILGLKSKEEALGINLNQIYKNPDDRYSIIEELRKHGRLFNHEYELIRSDGKTVYVIANIIGIFDKNHELVSNRGYIFDNTERKLASDELRKLSQAIEQSPVSIIITDVKGTIEYGNPKAATSTGYELNELIGKNPRILKSGEKPDSEYINLWKTISSGKEWFGEFLNKKKNGDLYWESASISPIVNSKGEITHYVAVKEDITEQKEMLEELVKSKEKAEESDRLKSAFLANISHEIRTPMNGILGFAELLNMPGLGSNEQQEYIQIIKKSGDRMLNIINEIVDISKIESGQMQLSLTDINMNDQVEFIYNFFKPEANSKGLLLFSKKSLSSNQSIVKTDREKIYAILTNLVKNAIKYTDFGSVEFGYNVVASNQKPTALEFFVKDTGIGIPSDRQKAIFERFIQSDISDKRAFQGAGLGLSIAKAYIEMLGGNLWVESEEGKGSTFYFTIPYLSSPKVDTEETNMILPVETTDQIKKLKVLIVEDDDTSVMLLMVMLKEINREILVADTGSDAIDICRENPDLDLILMDIKMPVMDGYDATRQIRQFNKDVVIIAQTAFGQTGDREKAIESGCNDYISKPLDIELLTSIISEHVKNGSIK